MAIRVVVTDTETGETGDCTIEDNYVIVTAGSCYVEHTDMCISGTHVITVRGRREGQRPGSLDSPAEP